MSDDAPGLRVAGGPKIALLPVAAGQPGWDQTRTDVTREVEHFLVKTAVKPKQLSVRVEAGEPSDTILQIAKDGGADLIVMGTHGRTGLSRLLIGSVAEAVLRRSTCPVLTLRVPGKTSHDALPL